MRSKNFILPLIFLVFALCMEVPLISSAQNLQVIEGEVSVVEQGEITKIYASDHSLITFSTFTIEREQEVQIIQPSEDSVLVIQVDSHHPTEIKNKLSANGHVYIVNPKGIFLDKTAQLENGSFHLIGAELLTENVTKSFNVAPSTGDIINHGSIQSKGAVHIIGRHFVNSGVISASKLIHVSRTNAKNQLSILHTGVLKSAEVLIESQDGICELYGRIEVKNAIENQYGGNICILAKQIRLIGAYLDASGDFGGGIVNLGGNFERRGSIFRANRTSIDHSSLIDVSAVIYGSGGEVLAWSKELTSFDGEIYARGGQNGGDGGRVVTSSQDNFGIYVGKVHVEANFGEKGCWLLDPLEVQVESESSK